MVFNGSIRAHQAQALVPVGQRFLRKLAELQIFFAGLSDQPPFIEIIDSLTLASPKRQI